MFSFSVENKTKTDPKSVSHFYFFSGLKSEEREESALNGNKTKENNRKKKKRRNKRRKNKNNSNEILLSPSIELIYWREKKLTNFTQLITFLTHILLSIALFCAVEANSFHERLDNDDIPDSLRPIGIYCIHSRRVR